MISKTKKTRVKKMDNNRGQHCIYCLTYHMIFVTHYRKPVINEEMSSAMKEFSNHMAEQFRGKILSAETDRDHIHLLVSLPPNTNVSVFAEVSRLSCQERCVSDSLNRSNSTSMGMIPHSGAAATLSPLPEAFLLKQ